MSSLAVVYLARAAEGIEPVRRFIDSYNRYPAGVAHDLVIVWKGFPNRSTAGSPQERICEKVQHRSITVTDDGFDITAYKIAAETLPHDYVCFLNTFSQIEAGGWLGKLYSHASRPEIGICGATGSLESIRESVRGMSKAIWLCHQGIPYDPLIAEQWGHEIVKYLPRWLEAPSLKQIVKRMLLRKAPIDYEQFEPAFELFWAKAGAPYANLPCFPNPHIRSNAFMVRRTLFLDALPTSVATKEDCLEFESGHTGLTNIIARRGLRAVVIGADGRAYCSSEWSDSRTFRTARQENKLVADNQTRDFDAMPPARKRLYEHLTWTAFSPE